MATWDARSWVADELGCGRDDLSVLSRNDGKETQVRYADKNGQVTRLVVAGPLRPLNPAEPDGHWEVALQLPDQTVRTPSEPVPGSTEIEY